MRWDKSQFKVRRETWWTTMSPKAPACVVCESIMRINWLGKWYFVIDSKQNRMLMEELRRWKPRRLNSFLFWKIEEKVRKALLLRCSIIFYFLHLLPASNRSFFTKKIFWYALKFILAIAYKLIIMMMLLGSIIKYKAS